MTARSPLASGLDLDRYGDTPIVLTPNPNTGYKWGEDGPNSAHGRKNPGYRGMQTLKENDEPLVVPNVEARSVFDGASLNGREDDPTTYKLDGALAGGVMVLREMVARAVDMADGDVREASGGEMHLAIVDGLETWKRQKDGFKRTLGGLWTKEGGVEAATLADLHALGMKANGTYCYVQADKNSPEYADLARGLLTSGDSASEVEEIAQRMAVEKHLSIDQARERTILELLSISSNADAGPAAGRGLALNFDPNAHAGAASADLFPIDSKTGRSLSIVPYPWVGEEAAMDYLEDDANYDRYLDVWRREKGLQDHMKMAGFDSPEDFKFSDWERFRRANRIRYFALVGVGCTFYSADPSSEGGEGWHFEGDGVKLIDRTGKLIMVSKYVSSRFGFGHGNPGHTLQMRGPKAIAVYGGFSGHARARKQRLIAF